MDSEQLLLSDNSTWSTGIAEYFSDFEYDGFSLLVAIQFSFGKDNPPALGLLDTASTWVVFSKKIIEDFNIQIDEDFAIKEKINTPRFGLIDGYLHRLPLKIIAETGKSLFIDATCFISDQWQGPPVIGWKGCLERIKFALDSSIDRFYFSGW